MQLTLLSVRSDNRGPFLDALGMQFVNPVAAAGFEALNVAFKAEFGIALVPVEGRRSSDRQNYLYQGYINHKAGFSLAAPPHTSNHEDEHGARAIDFGSGVATISSAQHKWLVANGPTYGWIWTGGTFTPKEGWHFEQNGTVVASTNETPTDSTDKETDMASHFVLRSSANGDFVVREFDGAVAHQDVNVTNQAHATLGDDRYPVIACEDQFFNSTWAALGLPDLGTVKAGTGNWFKPVAAK